MTFSKVMMNLDYLIFVADCHLSQFVALTDIAILIENKRLKRLRGLDKVTADLHRQQSLPFQDAINIELLE